jgi:hypothetical protein
MFPVRQQRISAIMRLVHGGEAALAGTPRVREKKLPVSQ